jgi:hypothetical protein
MVNISNPYDNEMGIHDVCLFSVRDAAQNMCALWNGFPTAVGIINPPP